MNERIQKLYDEYMSYGNNVTVCTEKSRYCIESLKKNHGWPRIMAYAQASADYMDKRTVFIHGDELLVGNIAAEYMASELSPFMPGWPDADLKTLRETGTFHISDEDIAIMREADKFTKDTGFNLYEWRSTYINSERLWPWLHRGFTCPRWSTKKEAVGYGFAGECVNMKWTSALMCPDYAIHIYNGFEAHIARAKEALEKLKYTSFEDAEKADFYNATIIVYEAAIRMANRYADKAEEMAATETREWRKKELLEIAETCRRVPAKPARTFREGMQAMMFYWLLIGYGAFGLGRMDQYLWPLYKADLDAGRITREQGIELIESFRLKLMEYVYIGGGAAQRDKWAGRARWNVVILGGVDSEGNDVTNDLSYMFIEAAKDTRTPHPSLTVRVHDKTPEPFLQAAIDLVRTGIGFPAFISDRHYINFLTSRGVSLEHARNFAVAGCLDLALPGASRQPNASLFIMPMVLVTAMYDGHDEAGEDLGPRTGMLKDFKSFEELYQSFLKQMDYNMDNYVEFTNVRILGQRACMPDALTTGFFHDSIEIGKDIFNRTHEFENASCMNVVGLQNVVDSLVAVDKLCFIDKVVTPEKMQEALLANWVGYEDIQKLCKDAPKYGNHDPLSDEIARRVYGDVKRIIESRNTIYGKPFVPSGVSISSHAPGGAYTPATPDGRVSGEILADGSLSPVQGRDKNGPLAVLQSAMNVCQGWGPMLLNMKFSPAALKTNADMDKLASMLRVYLTQGGAMVQFNVVDRKTLYEAKAEPDAHRDLLVRVAGYSAYFVNLIERVQDEVINRTEHML